MKHIVIPAHIDADSHDARVLLVSDSESCDDIADAAIIMRPERAEKNLTANSDHPNNFNASASSHHVPNERPAASSSPILGMKLLMPADI